MSPRITNSYANPQASLSIGEFLVEFEQHDFPSEPLAQICCEPLPCSPRWTIALNRFSWEEHMPQSICMPLSSRTPKLIPSIPIIQRDLKSYKLLSSN